MDLFTVKRTIRFCLPVIASTAFAAQGGAQRFRQAGLDGYVSKPVDFGRLAEEIRRVTNRPTERAG